MNVVDALVITLGLDSSQFRKDQVAVADSSRKLKESLVKDGKDVEKSGKDAAESWGSLKKEILGVAAAFLGLDAIKNAVGDVTKFNKEVSQSAQSIGVSAQELSAWGMAVERMGGDANSARASLQHLADIFNELKSGHASPAIFEWFGRLQAEGGVKLNAAKPMLEQLPQIAEGLKHIAQTEGAGRALFVGKQLGLDDGMIRLLMQGKDAVRGIVEDMRKLAPTAEQIDKTNQLYRAWVELKQMFESLANILTANFAPAFQAIIEKFTEWFGILKDNQKTPKLTFGEAKKQFNEMIDAIREGTAPAIKFFQDVFGPPIKWVIEQIKKLKHEINDVYRAMFGHDLFSESFNDVFDKYRHGGGASGEGGGSGARGASRAGVGARVRHGHRGGGEGAGPVAPRDPRATSIAMTAAMDQLRKEGVPEANLKAAAAHLVGQAEMESGLRPGLTHDKGTGYGIYGARLGRRDRMLSWLAANGYAKDSLEGQTRYMAHEAMSGRYKNTRNILMHANENSLGPDSRTITHEFESPRVDNDRSGAVRGAYRRGAQPSMPATLGAPGAAGARSSINNSSTTNSSNTEAVFNGGIAIHTQATDAPGLMRELQSHIDRQNYTAQANYGIA
jgi:hypothetical protein